MWLFIKVMQKNPVNLKWLKFTILLKTGGCGCFFVGYFFVQLLFFVFLLLMILFFGRFCWFFLQFFWFGVFFSFFLLRLNLEKIEKIWFKSQKKGLDQINCTSGQSPPPPRAPELWLTASGALRLRG